MKVQQGLSLADRMKKFENVSKYSLPPKQPIIVRLSGKNFKRFKESNLTNLFLQTMIKVIDEISQIEYGYHYSDEVIFFLKDYKTKKQEQYFNGNIQSINSLITSKFTYFFNKNLTEDVKMEFTCKVFSLPLYEVTNYFIHHQRESIKEVVDKISNDSFKSEDLLNKTNSEKILMLKNDGIDYETIYPIKGVAVKRLEVETPVKDLTDEQIKFLVKSEQGPPPETIKRTVTMIDTNLRLFSQFREDIDNIVFSGEGVIKPAIQLELKF